MTERTKIDDTIINLAYLYIKGATYLMDVMTRAVKSLALDKEITPEAKRALKDDLNFTSRAVQMLGQAQESYKRMMHCLEAVENELDKHVAPETYDYGMANMLDLLSADLVYLSLCHGEPEKEKKIHDYLKKFKWPEDLKSCYDLCRKRMKAFTK